MAAFREHCSDMNSAIPDKCALETLHRAPWRASNASLRHNEVAPAYPDRPIPPTGPIDVSTIPSNEEWLRDLADLSSDWLWEQDAEFRFTTLWGEMHARTGLNAGTTVGKRRWELGILGVNEEQWRAHREMLARHETFRDFQYQYSNVKGELRWLAVSGKAVFAADGGFAGYRGIGRDITTQKLAENALRESERRLRALLELSSDWYWVQDENHCVTAREGAILKRNLLSGMADLGQAPWEMGYLNMTEDDWAAHRALLARREEFRDLLLGRRNVAGEMRWARHSGRPLHDADGRFIGYHGIGHGVTEQVEAERSLRESEAQLRLLMQSVPVSIAHFDTALRLLYVNRAFEQVFGRAPEDLIGRHLREIIDQPAYAMSKPHFDLALQGITTGYRRIHDVPGASTRILDINVVPHRDASGSIVGCYGVAMDVTALDKAAEQVRSLQQRFGSAMENTTDLMAIYRVDGAQSIIEEFNPALRDFYEKQFAGVRIAQWIGQPIEKFLREVEGLSQAALDSRLAPFRRVAASGQIVRYRSSIASSAAAAQERDALMVPITDAHGRVTHLFYRGADITELVQKEEELQRLNADLERKVAGRTAELSAANRELEAFAYSVSHDLRAPLRGIDGFSQLLLEQHSAALGSQGTDYLQRVRRGIQRMGNLIDDLLKLSRVTRAPLIRTSIDLSAMAAEIAADLQRQMPERKVDWRLQPGVSVVGDPGLMRIMMDNLLGNAWKYTRDAVAPEIEFGATQETGADMGFIVRDNGAGFDMAYAAKLFQPFQRLHGPRQFDGTGIGLATVARIVERHGGKVRAEGETGVGATFHVVLPDKEA